MKLILNGYFGYGIYFGEHRKPNASRTTQHIEKGEIQIKGFFLEFQQMNLVRI